MFTYCLIYNISGSGKSDIGKIFSLITVLEIFTLVENKTSLYFYEKYEVKKRKKILRATLKDFFDYCN